MKNKKIILFSAPKNFISNPNFSCPKGYEVQFYEIREEYDFERIEFKEDVIAWLVNPCPEFFIGERILSQLPNLKILVTPSTGKTHIDQNFCSANKIILKGLLDSPVVNQITASSEFTFMLCLAVVRNLNQAISEVKKGNWRNIENKLRGREIKELKIGIVGFGRIGKNLYKYFDAMGSDVSYFDPYFNDLNKIYPLQAKVGDLSVLLASSDLVITSVTLNETTYKLVDEKFINKMKDGSIFINTARGDVIDENALYNALLNKKISACGLDVLSNENETNFLKNNKLLEYAKINDNLIITPHIAGLSIDSETKAQNAAFQLLLDNI